MIGSLTRDQIRMGFPDYIDDIYEANVSVSKYLQRKSTAVGPISYNAPASNALNVFSA